MITQICYKCQSYITHNEPMISVSEPEQRYFHENCIKLFDQLAPGNLYPVYDHETYFSKAISLIQEMHTKKGADYAEKNNEFSNFEQAAAFAGQTVQQQIDGLIGTKQARKLNLEAQGKQPNNESLLDTYLDRAVYAIIAYAYELKRSNGDASK